MNIFVGNLATAVTSEDLRMAFSGYGTVINALVMKDTASARPLGYGHVYLVPEQAARQAVAALNHVVLRGRPLIVRECVFRSKKDRRARKAGLSGGERRRSIDRRRNGAAFEAQIRQQA